MQITEIRMFVCDELRLKATLSLTLDGVFVVKGVKIIDGRLGMFVAMPSRKTDGGFEDICHPVTASFRDYLETEVFRAYAAETRTPVEEILARRRESPLPPRDRATHGRNPMADGSGPDRSFRAQEADATDPRRTAGTDDVPERGSSARPDRRPRGDAPGDGGPHPGP